jgi:hypothetical protein
VGAVRPEEALQIQWAAKMLHPDLFRDLDVRTEARNFYRTFFNYSLTEAELDQVFQFEIGQMLGGITRDLPFFAGLAA